MSNYTYLICKLDVSNWLIRCIGEFLHVNSTYYAPAVAEIDSRDNARCKQVVDGAVGLRRIGDGQAASSPKSLDAFPALCTADGNHLEAALSFVFKVILVQQGQVAPTVGTSGMEELDDRLARQPVGRER